MAEAQTDSKALTPRGQMLTTLNQRLGELEPKLAQLLPRFMPAKRFFMIAYDSVTRTPALQECTIPSILKCVIEAAEIGLEVGGPKKHAWLVPFRNKKTGKREAQLIPGYMGLAHLAYDAGGITKIEPHVVKARDHFLYEESPLHVEHIPFDEPCAACGGLGELNVVNSKTKEKIGTKVCEECQGTARQARGRSIKYYTVATYPNGQQSYEMMDRAEVEKIRARSKAKDEGPWVTDFDQMALKTVFKRHEKWLPKTDGDGAQRLARAIELDNQAVGLENAENENAVETSARPLPHELLEDDEEAEVVKEEKKSVSSPETAPAPDNKGSSPPQASGSSPASASPTTERAGGSQTSEPMEGSAGARTSATPAEPASSREPGDESESAPESGFKTSEEKAKAEGAETINPQRVGLLQQTAWSAGLDEMAVSEILKSFGFKGFEEVTNDRFSDVLARFAKLPPKGKGKK